MQTPLLDAGLIGLGARPQPDGMIVPETTGFLDQLILDAALPDETTTATDIPFPLLFSGIAHPNPKILTGSLALQPGQEVMETLKVSVSPGPDDAAQPFNGIAAETVLAAGDERNTCLKPAFLHDGAPIGPASIQSAEPPSAFATPPLAIPIGTDASNRLSLSNGPEQVSIPLIRRPETWNIPIPVEALVAPLTQVHCPDVGDPPNIPKTTGETVRTPEAPPILPTQIAGQTPLQASFPLELRASKRDPDAAFPNHPAARESALRLQLMVAKTEPVSQQVAPPVVDQAIADSGQFTLRVQPMASEHEKPQSPVSAVPSERNTPTALPLQTVPFVAEPMQSSNAPIELSSHPNTATAQDLPVASVIVTHDANPKLTVDQALDTRTDPPRARHAEAIGVAQQTAAVLAAQKPEQPGRIELTLTPETLGRLHFDMRPEGNSMAITLSAEHPETLDLMRRHLPDLLAELKQAGVQPGTLSFGTWSEGRNAPQQQHPIAGQALPDLAPPPVSPLRSRPAQPGSGGLDLRF